MAFKANVAHVGSYMLNPFPGLMHVSIIHPLKSYPSLTLDNQSLVDISSRVHIMSLRIIQNLATSEPDTKLNLIQSSTIDPILKKMSELNKSMDASRLAYSSEVLQKYVELVEKSMENLGQLLIMCQEFGYIGISKDEIKNIYLKYSERNFISENKIDQLNIYFQILFNN